jgi:hypothetical protein
MLPEGSEAFLITRHPHIRKLKSGTEKEGRERFATLKSRRGRASAHPTCPPF